MKKSEIKKTWDLSQLGTSLDDPKFKKERKKWQSAIEKFAQKWTKDTTYLSKASKLKQALDEYSVLYEIQNNEGYYLSLRSALDNRNQRIKAALKKFEEFHIPLGNKLTFFQLSLGTIDHKTQKKLLNDKTLSDYRFYLQGVFETARYDLSEKEENLLDLLSGVSGGNWVDMQEEFMVNDTEPALVKNKKTGRLTKEPLTLPTLMNNLSDKNKKIRDSAADGINAILERQSAVTEKEINSILEKKKIMDQLRGYSRPDQARHIADDIDSKTVDQMIQVVTDNFKVAKDYYKFKAQLFGQKQLAFHERNIEYGTVSMGTNYEDAVMLVHRAYEKLDDEFAQHFAMFAREGRMDAHPRLGKSDGAFCAGASKTTPTYILLNHDQSMRNIMTIAHEAGHGMHNQLMRPQQPPLYCGTTLATAEVASTFCEDFALQELLGSATDEQRLTILVQKIDDTVATIFRQVAFYNFETELHQAFRTEGYLTSSAIGKIFQKHMKSYMGPAVSQDPGSENWWMYIGHFRRPFYVYTYASGLMISMALQRMVREDQANIEKVKDFMRAGASDTTENIFQKAGVTIAKKTFWEQSIQEIEVTLKEAKKLAKQLGKI